MQHIHTIRRRICAVLTAALILAMLAMTGLTASAADAYYTVTLSGTSYGHTYTAYQILSGTVGEDGDTLEGIVEGIGIDSFESFLTALQEDDTIGSYFAGAATANDVAVGLQTEGFDTDANLVAFANVAAGKTSSSPSASVTANTSSAAMGLPAGYYLITDVYKGSETNYVVSRNLLIQVTESRTVAIKDTQPTLTKQIWHTDAGTYSDAVTASASGWGDAGDNQIGDEVWFLITVTTPDVTGYSKYTYVVTDTMSESLSFQAESVRVTYGESETELDASWYTVSEAAENADGSTTFTVTFVDMIGMVEELSLAEDTEIHIYFSAVLTAGDAESGESCSSNTAYLTYSNNPNGEGTGTTVEDQVYDWSFAVALEKIDATTGNAITGAVFVLSQNPDLGTLSAAEGGTIVDADGTSVESGLIPVTGSEDGTAYQVSASESGSYAITVSSGDGVTISGLDDGTTYYLYEVTAPVGYSKLTDATAFIITAAYSADGSSVNSLALQQGEDEAENMTLVIENTSTAALPETGGTGTAVIYFFGTVLVAGAVILLLIRRRRPA